MQITEKEIAEVQRKLFWKQKDDDQMVARIQAEDQEKETVEGSLCEYFMGNFSGKNNLCIKIKNYVPVSIPLGRGKR